MGTGIEIGIRSAPAARRGARDVAAPRVLLLAAFDGAAVAPLAVRRPRRVDLDSLDADLAATAPRLAIDGETLVFRDLDDFRPEALLRQRPALRVQAAAPTADDDRLLASLLGGAAAPAATALPAASGDADAAIEQWLRTLVGTVGVAPQTPASPLARAMQDAPTVSRLLARLGREDFRALESAWLGLARLLSRLPAGIALHRLSATPAECVHDLVAAAGRPLDMALARAVDPGDAPAWDIVVVPACFGAGAADLALLAALATLGRERGFVVLADADIATALADAAAWQALSAAGCGAQLALTTPRPRLRRPYGARTDPVAGLALEEQVAGSPDTGPWGSAALMVLEGLLAGAEGAIEHDDLPLGTPTSDPDAAPPGGLERRLDESTAMRLSPAGLMPWLGHRDGLVARLPLMQTLGGSPLLAPG